MEAKLYKALSAILFILGAVFAVVAVTATSSSESLPLFHSWIAIWFLATYSAARSADALK